jgi:hypothetical protein
VNQFAYAQNAPRESTSHRFMTNTLSGHSALIAPRALSSALSRIEATSGGRHGNLFTLSRKNRSRELQEGRRAILLQEAAATAM